MGFELSEYDQKLQALINSVGQTSDEVTEKILKMLSESQKRIAGELATTEWGAHHLEEMKKAVTEAMQGFADRVNADMKNILLETWEETAAMTDELLLASGVPAEMIAAAPALSASQLEVMAQYSADLITNMAKDAIQKINQALTMGILGEKSLVEVMKEIGKNLTDSSVFGSIAVRAETIARTETARVFSAAREGRQKELQKIMADFFPDMKIYKMWLHSGNKKNARKNHLKIHKKVVPVDEDFPGGLPYPHAPGLTAKEVINCRCVKVLIFPGMKGYPDGK